MKINKKIKRLFSGSNLTILICFIVIIISIYIILKPNDKIIVTPGGIRVVQTQIKSGEELSEEQARKVAVKQFEILDEEVRKEDLNVIRIQRNKEKYYYITSANNSLEIKISDGKIMRINAAPVQE